VSVSCKLTTKVIKRKRRKVVVCTVKNLKSSSGKVAARLLRNGRVATSGSGTAKGGRARVTMGKAKAGRYKVAVTNGGSTVRLNLDLR
jgi:hypothetical protein